MLDTGITLFLAVVAYFVLVFFVLRGLLRHGDLLKKRRQDRRDWVMARLIFEHKSGSKL